MSTTESITVVRMYFKSELTDEDIISIIEPLEPTLNVDRYEGGIGYVSVDESKATYRPRLVGAGWCIERIVSYEYECFDSYVSITSDDLDGYLEELMAISGVDEDRGYEVVSYTWYNGGDEPE